MIAAAIRVCGVAPVLGSRAVSGSERGRHKCQTPLPEKKSERWILQKNPYCVSFVRTYLEITTQPCLQDANSCACEHHPYGRSSPNSVPVGTSTGLARGRWERRGSVGHRQASTGKQAFGEPSSYLYLVFFLA